MGNKRTLPSTANGAGLALAFSPNATMAGTSTITSQTVNCQNLDNLGLQLSWSGTPTGTIAVNASIDNVNFVGLTFNPVLTQPSGSVGSILVNLNQIPYPYIQVSYTNASGSGTLTAYLSGKDLN